MRLLTSVCELLMLGVVVSEAHQNDCRYIHVCMYVSLVKMYKTDLESPYKEMKRIISW